MNKLSMTCEHTKTRMKKYGKAQKLPHVLPLMQSGGCLLQSNMMRFQSSPVVTANKSRKAYEKLLKFFSSSMTSPSFTSLNMNTPANENMKKNSKRSRVTLTSEGIEKIIVLMIAWRPSCLPKRRMTRVTRKTLSSRAICGPI